jgi:NifU-like protein
MAYYPREIAERFRSPRYAGRVSGSNAVGTSASFQCGCFARISLAIRAETKTIYAAGFQSNGCGFMIAAADVIAERLSGTELTDLHSLDENEFIEDAEADLGAFPTGRRQCIHVVLEAVRAALANYRALLVEEFRGEKAMVCTCFGVSEDTVESFISANSPDSVDEVTAACRAGAGCGSCRMLIQEMIDGLATSRV